MNIAMEVSSALQFRERVEDFRRRHRTGLVTLLFSDMVGSTLLKDHLGDDQGVAVIQSHHATVRALLGQFQEGEEISTWGDAFFIVFVKPSDAVRFALLLQHQLRELSARAAGEPVQDRIGIHVGEVVVEEAGEGAKPKDLYGLQVDLSARLMSLAGADQILVSRLVFDSARPVLKGQDIPGLAALSWLNHGRYRLAGVEEPTEVCEVGETGSAALQPPADTAKARRVALEDGQEVVGWRPALGQVVPGTRWELERKLGEGGFGEVWLASHRTSRQRRVFKFCFRPDRVRWLKREVALFRVLQERVGEHPHIVRLVNVNLDEAPFYLEMDYCEGGDLKAWSESQDGPGRVPLATRLQIIAQVADALEAAHGCGIVHRDLKPGNILIQPRRQTVGKPDGAEAVPVARLTDFGVGHVVSTEALAGLTMAGLTQAMPSSTSSVYTGTLMYLAPELLSGQTASPQSDIYSLGVVLYQFLAGDFSRALTMDWAKALEGEPALRTVLERCFAGDPSQRFASAGELAASLRGDRARVEEREREVRQEGRRSWRSSLAWVRGSLSFWPGLVLMILAWVLILRGSPSYLQYLLLGAGYGLLVAGLMIFKGPRRQPTTTSGAGQGVPIPRRRWICLAGAVLASVALLVGLGAVRMKLQAREYWRSVRPVMAPIASDPPGAEVLFVGWQPAVAHLSDLHEDRTNAAGQNVLGVTPFQAELVPGTYHLRARHGALEPVDLTNVVVMPDYVSNTVFRFVYGGAVVRCIEPPDALVAMLPLEERRGTSSPIGLELELGRHVENADWRRFEMLPYIITDTVGSNNVGIGFYGVSNLPPGRSVTFVVTSRAGWPEYAPMTTNILIEPTQRLYHVSLRRLDFGTLLAASLSWVSNSVEVGQSTLLPLLKQGHNLARLGVTVTNFQAASTRSEVLLARVEEERGEARLRLLGHQTGSAVVTLSVADWQGRRYTNNLVIEVVPVNHPPVIASVGPVEIAAEPGRLSPEVPLQVFDPDPADVGKLVFHVVSGNEAVVRSEDVAVRQVGQSNWTVQVWPRSTAPTPLPITVWASDGRASNRLVLTVTTNGENLNRRREELLARLESFQVCFGLQPGPPRPGLTDPVTGLAVKGRLPPDTQLEPYRTAFAQLKEDFKLLSGGETPPDQVKALSAVAGSIASFDR